MAIMDQARADGLAASAGRPHPGRAGAALAIAAAIAFLSLPPSPALAAIVAAALAGAALLFLAKNQIGGITGDALGALQQTVEVACLLALAALL
jgi:adenosylcobinamide-GDP ribazoletransferase